VLLFEFFPLFVALLGALAVVYLFMSDRRARQDPNDIDESPRSRRPPRKSSAPERPGRRPSMLP
jgi:hypothetical protein